MAGNRRLLPLVVVTGLTLLALDASGFGPIGALRRGVLAVAGPVGVALEGAASPLTVAWNGAVHYDEVVAENHELRRRLADAEGRLAAQPDLRSELADLAAAVDVAGVDDIERVTARVVADRRSRIERIVELDKGTDDGIASGMPVVTGAGLVGVVTEASAGRAAIRLLTDADVAVGVRGEHGIGLVAGGADGTIELEPGPDLARAVEAGLVGPGYRLVTSGAARSRFPAGLPVARLAGDGTLLAEADLGNLGYLTVLLVDRPA
ncbi:MAG: rod shape-determining protein MreC [Actinomycetota bacterium]